MTPAELTAAGEAVYGERWQTKLAEMLGVSTRTLRRWVSGANPIPEGIEENVKALVALAARRAPRKPGGL